MIITLTGPNEYLIKQTIGALVSQFEAKHGAFGIEQVSGETMDEARLADLMQGASLFAASRLVILREASLNKPLWESLSERLHNVPAETMLVVVEPSPDKRTKTYKALKAQSDFREFGELAEGDLVRWIIAEVHSLDGQIDAKTAHHLAEQTGPDQWRLAHELQKLVHFNPHITPGSIAELVEPTPQATAFELLDATMARKPATVRQLLERLSFNEDPYRFFGLLVSHVHALAVVHAAGNLAPATIAKDSGLHPFVVRKTQGLARDLTRSQLAAMINAVSLCDMQLKSTGADPWLLLGQCLGKLASTAID